jgi:hypothetical protein
MSSPAIFSCLKSVELVGFFFQLSWRLKLSLLFLLSGLEFLQFQDVASKQPWALHLYFLLLFF